MCVYMCNVCIIYITVTIIILYSTGLRRLFTVYMIVVYIKYDASIS